MRSFERDENGRFLSHATAATVKRLDPEKRAQEYEKNLLTLKKHRRKNEAAALLHTKTLRPEFKDRGDEFFNEYVESSDMWAVKLKWFLDN